MAKTVDLRTAKNEKSTKDKSNLIEAIKNSFCVKRIENGFEFEIEHETIGFEPRTCTFRIIPDIEVYESEIISHPTVSLSVSGINIIHGTIRHYKDEWFHKLSATIWEILDEKHKEERSIQKRNILNHLKL